MSNIEMEVEKNNVTNGKGIASLILGVISIVASLIPIAGGILGIIGLILGIIGLRDISRLKQNGKKIAIGGIVCSSLGILLSIVIFIVGFIAIMNSGNVVL